MPGLGQLKLDDFVIERAGIQTHWSSILLCKTGSVKAVVPIGLKFLEVPIGLTWFCHFCHVFKF